MDDATYRSLVEDDLNHWVHPLFHPASHQQPVLIERGEGIYVYGHDGKQYIDGLAALWNVAVGHGRRELGEAALEQMSTLGFNNSYEGYTNEPAIRLAKKVVGLAYPNMQALYFTNSGSESNETNFKAARFYWNQLGRPEKHKVITRVEAYHGNTIAMTAATGMKVFHGNFGPLVPNIINAATPNATPSGGGRIDAGNVMIDNIVATIEQEGPDSVAAVIAEPVQGAGGVYPPPADYFSQLRDVCDRYEILLIADEVITGFGRTGKWFALEHFDVQPDMMSIAKAITSGYVPLGAAIFSKQVHDVIIGGANGQKFMHAYTNAGHPRRPPWVSATCRSSRMKAWSKTRPPAATSCSPGSSGSPSTRMSATFAGSASCAASTCWKTPKPTSPSTCQRAWAPSCSAPASHAA